jgi:son of sevenless-like protein
MTSIPIICRVQALYPFRSNDPSSLSFNKDDYIDVLNKLPSGWWDGLYVSFEIKETLI